MIHDGSNHVVTQRSRKSKKKKETPVREPVKPKPPCKLECRMKCRDKISEERREEISATYDKIPFKDNHKWIKTHVRRQARENPKRKGEKTRERPPNLA